MAGSIPQDLHALAQMAEEAMRRGELAQRQMEQASSETANLQIVLEYRMQRMVTLCSLDMSTCVGKLTVRHKSLTQC